MLAYYFQGKRVFLSVFLSVVLLLTLVSFCDAYTPSASYLARRYIITASAGEGGSISPSGFVVVKRDGKKTFTITADPGYDISDVLVDGESVGAVTRYEFTKVKEHHTIEAIFIIWSYTITPSAGANGSIEPSEAIKVKHGSDQEFSISPNQGYGIEEVLVDEASVGPVALYTFTDISSDHTISATFISEFEVLDVTIPDESMKIGEVIPVTIIVEDDAGLPYTFISGSVGGYPLEGFQRISATTYSAYFTIYQGGNSYAASEDIPVTELIISNGTDLSTPYNLPVIQISDPLDADLPLITSMQTAGGIKKIGDVLTLDISADGTDYSLDALSSINGIFVSESNITFSESGGGNYILTYTIQEGDTDVGQDFPELRASVILIKPSGNTNLPYSTVSAVSELVIDAHAPVLTHMEAAGTEVGVGGTVKVTVTADGTGYTGGAETLINGVSLSSSRVAITELSDGLYELSYVVDFEDAAVAPGQLQVSIVMIDAAGNAGNSYLALEPNMLEIYTDLPEAALEGVHQVCEGEEAELRVSLTGRAPWDFDLSWGDTTITYTNISSSEYEIIVYPVQTNIYQVGPVTDVNGVKNTSVSEFQVDVNEATHVEIINLAPGYNVEDDRIKLEANVPGGTFSGPGVDSATGYFYPYIADTINSPHTIYYNYENANACVSIASQLVYVLGAQGAILIPESNVCSSGDPFIATVLKPSGETGSFRLLDSSSRPAPGLTDHGDNTATIHPDLLYTSAYTIEFQYFNEASLYLRRSFNVEFVEEPLILNLDETPYCQDAEPFVLQSNISDVVFEGPGVSGNSYDGFIFNPGDPDPGKHSLSCTTISENGCTASSIYSIEILYSPEVSFELGTECLPEGGELVSFDNLTSVPESVEIWSWNFGDPESGEDNWSYLMEPTHHYQEPGQKRITLSATTFDGCVAIYELENIIDSRPAVDFTWISDCYPSESDVQFIDRSTYGSASVDTVIWTFKNTGGDLIGKTGSSSANDTVAFPFDSAGRYQVDIFTMSAGGCSGELSKEILLRPTVRPGSEGYLESFDETQGLWTVRSENQVESWIWGEPDFTGYGQETGDNAWFTLLPSGEDGYKENSWIQSPCLDFTGFNKPLIQIDIMQSLYPYLSGAVLQYLDVMEEGWKTIGETSPGINWYNFSNYVNHPGGSETGWGTEVFNPDTDWVTAVHDLNQVAGKPNVTLRIAFTSNGQLSKGNQGFAVNNIHIAERSKIAVLEHFTNYGDNSSRVADGIIDTLGIKHSGELIDLQYHMDYPEMDPMNENNPKPSSTRGEFHYGVPQVPYSILDGGVYPYHRYSFSDLKESPVRDHLTLLTLEIPLFDIDLSVDWQEASMEASTTVTCRADQYNEFIDLYMVVFETSVTAYTGPNGDTHFRNVVLDMLPSAAGKLLGDNWSKGNSDTRTNTWVYKPYVENIEELAVAAFIQDRTTGRILQASADYKDETVGIPGSASVRPSLNIYPNPTQSTIYVNLGDETEYPGRLELRDINGRMVLSEALPFGTRNIQINISHLTRGIYILQWIESDRIQGVSKIVKTR
ncbi:MAG: T9SS type A sorting domain-containing protein [Bacteroidetes bacterium]|nr:T9SS type A sorting domain-containing protein [Bacteroidota bacterium]